MASFAAGLVLGLAVGVGGTFAYLLVSAEETEEEVSSIDIDSGISEPKKSKKRRRRRKGRSRQSGEELDLQEIDERVKLSPRDRKLVWRGPKVALPEQSVDLASGGGGRVLTQSEINQGLSAKQRAISQCIGQARGQAELAATIRLHMLVNGGGRVDKTRVQAPSYLMDNGLYECIGGVAQSMSFDAVGGHTLIKVPFDLSY